MIQFLLFLAKNAYLAFAQTTFQVWDQTHYHFNAFVRHAAILVKITYEYFSSIPILFITHFLHGLYLHRLGFDDADDLSDNGRLVWKPMASTGNFTDHELPAKRVCGFEGNASGNPAHMSISAGGILALWEVLRSTDHLLMEKTVLVDFGCGTGFAVLSAATQPFAKIVGVELDEYTAALAQKNLTHLLQNTDIAVPIHCTHARIAHQDMNAFDFTAFHNSEPPDHAILLFMYEPLWTIAKAEAHGIYHRILQRAQQCERPVFVAYYYEGNWNGDALPTLALLGAKQLAKWRYRSLNFACDNDAYLFKLN